MPSEAELAETFNVSRITIRKAMGMLTSDGLVTRSRGRGTFVTHDARESDLNRPVTSNVHGFLKYLNAVGQSTKLKVISLDRGEAPPHICVQMQVPLNSELVRAVRVRELKGSPYQLSQAYLLPEVGGDFQREDLSNSNMIDLVQRAGAKVEQVEQVMTATLADEFSAQLLDVHLGAPLMRMNRLFIGPDMVPFYSADILYRADIYEYRLSLRRDEGRQFMLDGSEPNQIDETENG